MKSPIGWERCLQVQYKYEQNSQLHTNTAHTRPHPHADKTRKYTEMQTQLATTYVPTLHYTASELMSEKNANTKISNILQARGLFKCKNFARGSHIHLGHYMPDWALKASVLFVKQNANTNHSTLASKRIVRKSSKFFVEPHNWGLPVFRSRAAILVPSSKFAP